MINVMCVNKAIILDNLEMYESTRENLKARALEKVNYHRKFIREMKKKRKEK